MSKQLRLDVAQLTDVGRKRPHNEDNMAYVIPKDEQVMARKGALFIVADGMGGHAAGEVASEIAVDTVTLEYYKDESEEIFHSLKNAIKRANAIIHQRAAENMLRSGMGTTCVAAALRGNMAYVANVGDSRAYIVRRGSVRQVSQDHSWVEEQVRAGLLTREQARSHAQRNVITRCLGTQAEVEVDVFSEVLEEGDSLILCTDGLSGSVLEDELGAIVEQHMPQESVYHLVERANGNGGPDNITAIVVRVQELGNVEPKATTRQLVPVGGAGGNEDTMVLGRAPASGSSSSTRTDDTSARPTDPLQKAVSGSLLSPEVSASPIPERAAIARRKRGRLFYPTMALFMIMLVTVAGGGVYYFLYLQRDVNVRLDHVDALLQHADPEQDPVAALQTLQDAQEQLSELNRTTLVGPQFAKNQGLQQALVAEIKQAIARYNQNNNIIIPSTACGITRTQPVSGPDSASMTSLVTIQSDTKATFSYVLAGPEGQLNLYRLTDQNGLESAQEFDDAQPVLLAGEGQRLFVLTRRDSDDGPIYTLHAFRADGDGALVRLNDRDPRELPNQEELSNNNRQPGLIASRGDDAYLVFFSPADPQPAILLHYNLSRWGDEPERSQATLSFTPQSVVVLPDQQLVILTDDGIVQRLTFTPGADSPTQPIQLHNPIPASVGVDPDAFTTWDTAFTVPQVANSQSLELRVTEATRLAVGDIGGERYLFVVDDEQQRVIQISYSPEVSQNTPNTPDAESTPVASPTPTQAVGGSNFERPQYVRQYVSSTTLSDIASLVVDSRSNQLNILTQPTPQSTTFTALNADEAESCSSSS